MSSVGPSNTINQPYVPPTTFEKFKENAALAVEYVLSTLIDFISFLALAILFPFDQVKRDPKEFKADSNNVPVILVHGYFHNSSGWFIQRYRLKKAGITNVFTVNLGVLPNHSIDDSTKKLQERIKQVKSLSKSDDVILVGHSMGGVVCSDYATKYAQDDKVNVKTIVTLGSPLQGTKMHIFGPGKCAREMAYHSEEMKSLGKKVAENKSIPFHHFASKTDLIMRPWQTALNESMGDDNHKNTIVKMGHASYLFSKKVSDDLIKIIKPTPETTV